MKFKEKDIKLALSLFTLVAFPASYLYFRNDLYAYQRDYFGLNKEEEKKEKKEL